MLRSAVQEFLPEKFKVFFWQGLVAFFQRWYNQFVDLQRESAIDVDYYVLRYAERFQRLPLISLVSVIDDDVIKRGQCVSIFLGGAQSRKQIDHPMVIIISCFWGDEI